MASKRFVKVPKIFSQTTKHFSHWKMLMINYFNILEVWDIVEKGYEPKYDKTTNQLTIESKLEEEENLYVENAILSSVSESVAIMFGNMTNAHDMWKALINRYEGNTQIKMLEVFCMLRIVWFLCCHLSSYVLIFREMGKDERRDNVHFPSFWFTIDFLLFCQNIDGVY